MCNISIERYTDTLKNIKKKSKNASDAKEEVSKDTLWLYCLYAYSRSTYSEMWIQCIEYKLWAHEKYTDDSPRGVFRPRQTRQLPRAVDLKGRLLSCQS